MEKQFTVGLILATREQLFNTFPPLGLGYVAASVKKELPDVHVILKEKIEDLINEKPDVIGISASSDTYYIAIEYAETIKQQLSIPVVIGGIHISLLPESLKGCFDLAVLGEGEITFVEFLKSYIKNKSLNYEELKKISGLIFRYNGEFFRTKNREVISDLDSLPHPIIEELPFYNPANAICLVSARGCPYKCSFCSSAKFAQKYRSFSTNFIIDQVDYWVNQKNARHIIFYDDLLIANKKKLAEIVTKLEELGILGKCIFNCQVRANLVTDDVCQLLKKLNVVEVGMGVESFSDKVLHYYNKLGCTAKINQGAIDLLYKYGIKVGPGIILGAPVETREDLLITLRAIFKNFKDGKMTIPGWGTLRPFPGTKVWDFAEQEGIVSPTMDWKAFSEGHYLCKEIPESEFFEIIEEWMTKYTLLLINNPGIGGNFVINDGSFKFSSFDLKVDINANTFNLNVLADGWDQGKLDGIRTSLRNGGVITQRNMSMALNKVLAVKMHASDYQSLQGNPLIQDLLDNETKIFLAKAISNDPLTTKELERLNRRLLEAVYPKQIEMTRNDIEKVWQRAKYFIKKIKARNASELGDELIVNFVEKDINPTFLSGSYEDLANKGHWLSKRAIVIVRYSVEKKAVIHGYIPANFFKIYNQSIVISVLRPDNTVIATKLIDVSNCSDGKFAFDFSLPPLDFASIYIITDKSVIPKNEGFNADTRELSFLLKKFSV